MSFYGPSIPKENYTLDEVLKLVEQAWWAGFNNSGEGNNGEHCQTSMQDLKVTCKIQMNELMEGKLRNQLPD